MKPRGHIDWIALWILLSAWATLSGWLLSACGLLDRGGLVLSGALLLAGLAATWTRWRTPSAVGLRLILRSRFVAPRLWLFLAALEFCGGLAYAPTNYDYLTYRFPRVLHWCWEHSWHWIAISDDRMNYSGAGFEWLMVPLFTVFRTDRLFFLINFVPYLFLPALIYAVLPRWGISRRVAWWWMWVLPCAYCFVLQAASAANDSFAAVYFLASLHFVYCAKKSSPAQNLLLSCLAIGLTTGAKASNLPLVLPWALTLYFERHVFISAVRPLGFAAMLVAAAAVSYLPIGLLNIEYTGDFAGDPHNSNSLKIGNPIMGVAGNSLQFLKDNLAPPLLPHPVDTGSILPAALKQTIARGFPRLSLEWGEMQMEEGAGAGLGWSLLLGVIAIEAVRSRRASSSGGDPHAMATAAAVLVALGIYFCKMGSESTSRLVAAYYPVLTASILVFIAADGRIVHRRLFRWTALLAMLSAFPLVILSPSRPLFPALTLCDILGRHHIPLGRLGEVYRVYASRADPFHDFTTELPPGERTVGVIRSGSESEVSLWHPFGCRQVVELSPRDAADSLRRRGGQYIFVSDYALTVQYRVKLADLLAQWPATLVSQRKLVLLIHLGPQTWYLVRLDPPKSIPAN